MPDLSNIAIDILAFIVVIGPLILIHEIGHFVAARLIGVTVLEFGIGFPPRALKLFTQGGTEFTLNWLPIGGFVRPLGEDMVRPVGDETTDKERIEFEQRQANLLEDETGKPKRKVKTKSLMEAGPWQRIFFMSAGVGMNLITGFVLFVIVALSGVPQLVSARVQVLAVAANSPAQQAGLQAGDVITGLNGEKVETSQDIDDLIGNREAKEIKLVVKRGDNVLNISIKPSDAALIPESGKVIVTEVSDGSPAALVGLKFGDQLIKVDDQVIKTNNDLLKYNEAHLGQEVTLTYLRNGETGTVKLTPRKSPPTGQGPLGASISTLQTDPAYGLQLVDMDPVTKTVSLPLGEALRKGFDDTVKLVKTVVAAPVNIIRGTLSVQDARPVSIVGIAQLGGQVVKDATTSKQGGAPILQFAAIISVAIGITQLLPIPGLDGGRIIFVLVELLRGKPMNPEREGMVHLIGLMVLLGLMAIFVVNDLLNPLVLR